MLLYSWMWLLKSSTEQNSQANRLWHFGNKQEAPNSNFDIDARDVDI
mgnify:CR=1 FL=1